MDFGGTCNFERAKQAEGGSAKLYTGETVLIEKVFRGRRGNKGMIRAKIHTSSGVRYVNYCDLQVWGR